MHFLTLNMYNYQCKKTTLRACFLITFLITFFCMSKTTNPDHYVQPLQMFYRWEQERSGQTLFHQPIKEGKITFTWKEAAEQIRRMATALQAMNLPPSSNIALVSKNCAHWIMADLAIMMSGHISVPIYPNVNAETIRYVLEHSQSKVLFVGKLDNWENMKKGLTAGVHCISFPLYYGETGYESWDSLVQKNEPLSGQVLRNLDETATIIYTSGTTGKPKGVMHTFGTMSYTANRAFEVIDIKNKAQRFFSYLPLSHIAERMLVEMGCIYTGSEAYFAESLDTFARNLTEASPTIFLGVPRIWTKFQTAILSKMPQKKLNTLLSIPFVSWLVKRKIQRGLGLDKATICLTGAAPTPASLILWFRKIGIEIHEAYGMTENCAYSHFNRIGKGRPGSAGQAMPDVEVRISPVGEVLVRNAAIMTGYYKQPELTAEVIDAEGFLHTGDKGVVSADGYLTITGRVKELFKTEKGKYVAPSPIEMLLAENPLIEQTCVTGANLPQPIALAVLSADAQNQERSALQRRLNDTLQSVNERLDAHEKLRCMVVLQEPWTVENDKLTPTLKIKRDPIEQQYSAQYTTWYAKKEPIIWE